MWACAAYGVWWGGVCEFFLARFLDFYALSVNFCALPCGFFAVFALLFFLNFGCFSRSREIFA